MAGLASGFQRKVHLGSVGKTRHYIRQAIKQGLFRNSVMQWIKSCAPHKQIGNGLNPDRINRIQSRALAIEEISLKQLISLG